MSRRPPDEPPLDAALRAIAERDLGELVEEAAAEARAEVKRRVRDRLVELMLADLRWTEIRAPSEVGEPPVPGAEEVRGEPAGQDAEGCYVYGIVEPGSSLAADMPPGLGGGAVRLLPVDGVCAAVGEVPLREFGENGLRANLSDSEWVERAIRTHEAVLEHLHRAGAVLPMRFGVVFSDPDRAVHALTPHGAAFRADLRRLRGRSEWGVRITWDERRLTEWVEAADPELAQLHAAAGEAADGRAFFVRRQAEALRVAEARRVRMEAAARIHERLDGIAEESVEPRESTPDPEGRPTTTAAYLAANDREPELRTAAEELAARFEPQGIGVRLTGPWPPYSFARTEDDGPG